MKTIVLFSTLLISTFCFAQENQRVKAIMTIVDQQDSISRAIFLDSSSMKGLEMTQTSNWRQVWSGMNDSVNSVEQFFDIRIKFDSNQAALDFHEEYLPENSENGPEIRKHKIKIDGVDDLKVYTQNKVISQMMLEPYGLQALCFLFVVDQYFVKFYITCDMEYEPSYFKPYILEARDRIKAENGG